MVKNQFLLNLYNRFPEIWKQTAVMKRVVNVLTSATFEKSIVVARSTRIPKTSKLKTTRGGHIHIGERCEIFDYVEMITFGGFIEVGNDCSFNPFCMIYGNGGLKIGNNVRIATHTVIIPANHSFQDLSMPIMFQPEQRQGIIIEDDVWIGASVNILDGVKIGRGTVIGAGSVVNRSIPEYSIAVGIPAKVIKNRQPPSEWN